MAGTTAALAMSIAYFPGKEPHPREHRLIFKNVDRVDWDESMDRFFGDGGYEMLKKAVTMEKAAITGEVKASGLRGRGGAGSRRGEMGVHSADEHEAGLSDLQCGRIGAGHLQGPYILHQDPHQLIEGMAITA